MNKNLFSATDSIIQDFEKKINGTILLKEHSDFEEVRHIWNLVVDAQPALIVRCKNTEDVVASLAFAKEHQLPIAVRSAGHSLAGFSAGHQCLVIDLSQMKEIELDVASRTARIEPGATWGDVVDVLQPHGLAITSGDNAGVGVGGLTQGSGIGFMVRKYGLTIDRLKAVELVTAEGEIIRSSKNEHPDLFWGIRGGAGNFGIVTALEFDVHDGGEVLGGFLFYEGANAADLLKIGQLAEKAPEELTTSISIMTAPDPFVPSEYHNKPVLAVMFCYTGNLEEGERVIAPFREIGTVIADMVKPMAYPDLMENLDNRFGYISRNMYLPSFDHQTAETFVKDINEHPFPPFAVIQLRVLGGAVSRVPADETAFAHRDKPFLVIVQNIFMTKEQEEGSRALNKKLWQTIQAFSAGAEINFLGDDEKNRLNDVYPDKTLDRLIKLKKRYDPENIFKSNLNVPSKVQ
ncbi:hypothetical protein B5P41_27335 [Bacillus sp. SRB_28]|nr:hypothetical protein B5P41_27335 [Bacillus sp. SRB_28]